MKKKDSLTQKDKEDWSNFLKDTSRVPDKDQTLHTDSVEKRFRFDFRTDFTFKQYLVVFRDHAQKGHSDHK